MDHDVSCAAHVGFIGTSYRVISIGVMKVRLTLLFAIAIYFVLATTFGSVLAVGNAGPFTP